MPAPYNFPVYPNTDFAFIVREGVGYISREEVIIASGAGILPGGTILSRRAADGHYIPWAAGMTNAAILCTEVDTTGGAVKRTIVARHCEVQRARLFFAGTPTDAQKNEAYTVLAASQIVMR